MEKPNFGSVENNKYVEGVDNQGKEEITKNKLNKKEREDLNSLLNNNEMHRISELKKFVSSLLSDSDIEGPTAVYFERPNGFKVQIYKELVQSSMNNKDFLPSNRSVDLNEYEKIAEILQQNPEIKVDTVSETGVFGTVAKFSKDTYVSSHLGTNPEDDEMKKERVLKYMSGQYDLEEDVAKITKIKESIYSFFKKDK